MKTSKEKFSKRLLAGLTATVVTASTFYGIISSVDTLAVSWCTTDRCKEAEAAEKEASEKANNAAKEADTLDGEINRLNEEIRMYQARIVANRAKAEDLQKQIEENTKKLEIQKDALADMIISMYLEGDTDELMVLASSNSISDYAERQTRLDSTRDQISFATQMVESLKKDLEAQKKEVDRVIADQEIQQQAIEETKRREEELVAVYRANEAAYAAESAAARKVKEAEIAEAIRKANSTGAIGDGTNTYPKRNNCPQDNLKYSFYGGYVCQCVSYTGWKVFERYGIRISAWGNANQWHNTARRLGYTVDHTPEAGSVAISTSGAWGHAMWVEGVNPNGTINLSEYNNSYSSASHKAGDFGYRIGVSTSGLWFIHFS
ncbi:CHAP domain-containing protein [Candidatus Saccharibacteria bacterium]|nr:CHAP domain-containing protein [Candidatus Saccharibacteria bacterium]